MTNVRDLAGSHGPEVAQTLRWFCEVRGAAPLARFARARDSYNDDPQARDCLRVNVASVDQPFAAESFAALRAHPDFRAAIERHARENLALYAGCSIHERWLISDLGRAALSGAALILDAIPPGLTAQGLHDGAAAKRICSRGRVNAYLNGCLQQGFFSRAPTGEGTSKSVLTLAPSFLRPMLGALLNMVRTVATFDPRIAPALPRFADFGDASFRRGFFLWLGVLLESRPDLFNGPDKPVLLFLNRDGGSRVLECLLAAQPVARQALLTSSDRSQTALARASFTSRAHVARLLADGASQGLLNVSGREITFSGELSDDVERHYAYMFELTRVSVLNALASADQGEAGFAIPAT